ncbi:MAG: Rrf2 family transcriptional regulator [Parcubacteria group bacterium]|nr:Rrf2 family transcriptional regulator [Parcubacteria group bacterium]
MLQISTKGDYGLSILLYLGAHYSDRYISLKEISSSQTLPPLYLAQIILKLKNAGLIESKEGKSGGHRLAKTPEKISLLEILESLEGDVSLTKCLNPDSRRKCSKAGGFCRTMIIWSEVVENLKEYLNRISLKDLVFKAYAKDIQSPIIHPK